MRQLLTSSVKSSGNLEDELCKKKINVQTANPKCIEGFVFLVQLRNAAVPDRRLMFHV